VQSMQEGQTIKHEVYGLGIVTASDQERTSVDFDDHGPKLFVTSMMTAELIGEAPATPPKTKRRRKASTAAKAAKAARKSLRSLQPPVRSTLPARFERSRRLFGAGVCPDASNRRDANGCSSC